VARPVLINHEPTIRSMVANTAKLTSAPSASVAAAAMARGTPGRKYRPAL
jgi:hypothetical protein